MLQVEHNDSPYVIKSYGIDYIAVNAQKLTASFIVCPDKLLRNWRPQTFAGLKPEDFAPIVELEPEIVLLGTGGRLRFPTAEIIRPLLDANIALECMDTRAACRSYSILAAEDRKVAAALLMIGQA